MQDQYELDYELDSAKFDSSDEFDLPEAPDSWTLEDFGDVVSDFDSFSL